MQISSITTQKRTPVNSQGHIHECDVQLLRGIVATLNVLAKQLALLCDKMENR